MEWVFAAAVWYLWRELRSVRGELAAVRKRLAPEEQLARADAAFIASRRAALASNGRYVLGAAAVLVVTPLLGPAISWVVRMAGFGLTDSAARTAVNATAAALPAFFTLAWLGALIVAVRVLPEWLAARIPPCPSCGKSGEHPICEGCGLLLD